MHECNELQTDADTWWSIQLAPQYIVGVISTLMYCLAAALIHQCLLDRAAVSLAHIVEHCLSLQGCS
jgi:hypothetical protein